MEFARKVLGLDVEMLVVPRDPDDRFVAVEAVLADEGRLDLDLAAVLVRDGQLVEPDGVPAAHRLVDDRLAVAVDPDAAVAGFVARAPVDAHRAADLDGVRLDAEELRHGGSERLRRRVEDEDAPHPPDGLPVRVLRLEDEPVGAGAEVERALPRLGLLFGELEREDLLALLPRPPVPGAVLLPAVAPSSAGRLANGALRPLQAEYAERPLHGHGRAGERGERNLGGNGPAGGRPLAVRPDARAPGDGPDLERRLRRARLAGAVRDGRRHGEPERRVVREVGRRRRDGRELDREGAVLVGRRLALRDEALAVVVLVAASPAEPAAPVRIERPALHVPRDLRALHREARVGERRARHGHRRAERRLLRGLLQLRLELRPLVFLDVHDLVRLAASAVLQQIPGIDRVAPGEPVRRRDESMDERTPLVGLQAHRVDFLSVRVLERQPHGDLRLRPEVARARVGVVGDALHADRLAGAVDRAVREEVDVLVSRVFALGRARPVS